MDLPLDLSIRSKSKKKIMGNNEKNIDVKNNTDELILLNRKPSVSEKSYNLEINSVKRQCKSFLPCEICNKTFDRPSLLKRHIRTHTGEKPHICEICKKGFSTSSSLNTHRRIHSGVKPHVCGDCGKRFTASSNLYYHKMTHTKEKPHKCNQCTKSFPTPGDLRSHTYVHSGSWPFRCSLCSRGFSKQTNLRNHVTMHTGERPFFCNICNKKFALQCNLKSHLRKHYEIEQNTMIVEDATITQNKVEDICNNEIEDTITFLPSLYKNWLTKESHLNFFRSTGYSLTLFSHHDALLNKNVSN